MGKRMASLTVVAVFGLLLATPVWADLLYDNGPIGGGFHYGGRQISSDVSVSNSFTLGGASNLTGAQIGVWVGPGETPLTVDWSIGTDKFLSDKGSGTGNLTNTLYVSASPPDNVYDWYESTFPLSGTLGAGTYWLTLTNATSSITSAVVWSSSNGPSQAWGSHEGNSWEIDWSESFQIYGSSSAVPEPGIMLLLVISMISVAGLRRWWKD